VSRSRCASRATARLRRAQPCRSDFRSSGSISLTPRPDYVSSRSVSLSVTDRVSFPLYSAREFPPLDGQLATLAKLGYKNVEPYGGLFQNPDELKAGLKKHKLATPTAHIGIERFRADPEAVAKIAKDFGIKLVIVPAVPTEERSGSAA